MTLLASEHALCGVEFQDPRRLLRLDARLERWWAPYEVVDADNDVT
jgi:hypothetical protein